MNRRAFLAAVGIAPLVVVPLVVALPALPPLPGAKAAPALSVELVDTGEWFVSFAAALAAYKWNFHGHHVIVHDGVSLAIPADVTNGLRITCNVFERAP